MGMEERYALSCDSGSHRSWGLASCSGSRGVAAALRLVRECRSQRVYGHILEKLSTDDWCLVSDTRQCSSQRRAIRTNSRMPESQSVRKGLDMLHSAILWAGSDCGSSKRVLRCCDVGSI